MLADIGTAALPLTVTFTDTVPEVTTAPAQLEAEFADDTVLVPSVNFQPATYHAATNNPVRLLKGSERFNGTFTSVSVEGVTPRVRPEILQQKYGVELTGTKGSKPLVNWVLWSTLGKTRVIEGTLIELCGTAAGLS
jgi:hypothetical protein